VSIELGSRLRAVRRQRGLSLQDVATRTGHEFQASAVSAYERGDRALSVTRLLRLAKCYGVPAQALLPRATARDAVPRGPNPALRVDLVGLSQCHDPDSEALRRFAATIQRQRHHHTPRVLSIRNADVSVLAAALGHTPAGLDIQLDRLGMRLEH